MKRVLRNYLRRRVAGQILGLLLALTALIQLLELLEVTTSVLERKLGIVGVLHYAMLRIPSEMLVALPLAGLLGSMSAFYAMARTREITALRTAGIGLHRILWYLLPVPILFALLHVALAQKIVPAAEASLQTWWESTVPLEDSAADPQWVRTNRGILLFERRSADGMRLLDLRIYERGSDGLLQLRTRAREARWQSGQWRLTGITDLQAETGISSNAQPERDWDPNIDPTDIMQLEATEPRLSSIALAEVIGGERVSTRPTSFYQTVLMQSFVAPFTVFIMMLLAMPAAIVSERGGGGGRVLLALFLGLGFLIVDGIFSAFGTSGRISALLAACAAPLTFALFGFLQLRASERA